MQIPPNYIQDVNKFKLAGPPDHFRRSLWAFDDSLVIVPSRQGFYYRLAQRRAPNLPTAIVNEALFKESDTQMLASYRLVPVTTILASANWSNPFLIEELRRRAPWRLGGADAVIKNVEGAEDADEVKKREAEDDRLTRISKDGWQYYRKKAGLQTHGFSLAPNKGSDKMPSLRKEKKAPALKIGSLYIP